MICPFTNTDVGLAVLAPGCDSGEGGGIEVAFGDDGAPARAQGTAEAATIVSAAEASMRAYSPTLTYSQVQGCITSTQATGGNLDTAAAFDACGLGQIVNEGMAAYRAANGAPSGGATSTGPGSPASVRGPPNGTNASDQAKLTVRWKSTTKPTRTSAYGAPDRVTGRLTNPAGQPITGALLDVSETPADEGARAVSLAGVRTGSTGAWTLTLPKGISSSALRFAYRSHVDDTIPVATAALALRVHAGIALRIAPHVTSVGRSIFFSGTLHGAPIPPGKQLVLEASSGGDWIQFDTISATAKGRYRASYRFKFPGPVTYRFRVLSPYEADFPFLDGASNVVDVHER